MNIKNKARWIVLGLSLFLVSLARAEDAPPVSPVGNWMKLDHETKEPEAIIQITEMADHVLQGKVIRIYDPAKNRTTCQDCPEDFKNKPIVGMEVLWGLKQESDYTWDEGQILSPKLGKVFPCNLTLSQDGQTLTIRVYGGLKHLLGKTQTWYRAS